MNITLRIAHSTDSAAPLEGFRFFWAYYVSGFKPEFHCQPCFRGRLVQGFSTGRVETAREYVLDSLRPNEYVYVCGVGTGPKSGLAAKNFHLPLRHEPGGRVVAPTYNGFVVTVENAVAMAIPSLPDGWNGRDRETTGCKNFQFAVAQFGYPAQSS